jgi:protein O-mannosyl-transferase
MTQSPEVGRGHLLGGWKSSGTEAAGVLLLVALVIYAFCPILSNGFADSDDLFNFEDNHDYRGFGLPQLEWAWRTTLLGVYQPLSWMLFSAEYVTCGLDPRGYHLVSLLMFAATSGALLMLVRTLVTRCSPAPSDVSRQEWTIASAAAVGLFAVHPLRVEVIAWASSQPYLPCALLGILSVLAYIRAHDGRPSRRCLVAVSLLLFAGSLLFKVASVTLPVVLVILDVHPLRRLGGRRGWFGPAARWVWAEKLPWLMSANWWNCTVVAPWRVATRLMSGRSAFLASQRAMLPPLTRHEPLPFVVIAVVFMVIATHVRQVGNRGSEFTSLSARTAHACASVGFYPLKTILPVDLIADYPMERPMRWSDAGVVRGLAVLVGVSAMLVSWRRRYPGLLAAWVAYLAVLAPVSGFIHGSPAAAADRYSYLATMCWIPVVAAVLIRLPRTLSLEPFAVRLAMTAAVAGLAILSRAQCRTWKDQETLYRHALAHGAAQSILVHADLGAYLQLTGRPLEALDHFHHVMRLDPTNIVARGNAGGCLTALARYAEAEPLCADAVQDRPQYAGLYYNYGKCLAGQGKYAAAAAQFAVFVRMAPDSASGYQALGDALLRQGRSAEAVEYLTEAIRLRPQMPEVHYTLGLAHASLGSSEAAIARYSEALRNRPDYPEARLALREATQRRTSSQDAFTKAALEGPFQKASGSDP